MDRTNNENNAIYDVFLSYRHKPRDNRICKKTHTFLETFKPPRRHKQATIRRVFRDDDELPVAGVLSDTIGEALKNARVLLVICSPDTPESQWVDREVRTFIEMGRSDRIFALLLDDDPSRCFPHALRLVPGIEGRTLRIQARTEKQSLKKLKKELVRVVAAATETPLEPLRISVRNRRVRRSILAGVALSLFLFASGLYSLYQWTKASYYNLYTQREELVIHDVIYSIIFSLPEAVETLPGATTALVEILEDNVEYLDRMMAIDQPTDQMLTDKGNTYLSLTRAYLFKGDNDKALKSSEKAVEVFEELDSNSNSSTSTEKLAICYNLSGLYAQSMNKYEEAIAYLKKAAAVYEELGENESQEDYLKSRADCLSNIAVCYYYQKDYTKAADYFIKDLALRRKISGDHPSLDDQIKLADLASSAGTCLVSAYDYDRAAQYNKEAVIQYKSIFEQTSKPENYKSYVLSLYSLGISQAFLKDDKNAEFNLRLCLAEADKLVSEALPEFDPNYLSMYAMYDLLYGEDTKKQEALNIAQEAYEKKPEDPFVRFVRAYSLLFCGYYDESLEELKSLINENQGTLEDIGQDFKLFTIRGRPPKDMQRLQDELAAQ